MTAEQTEQAIVDDLIRYSAVFLGKRLDKARVKEFLKKNLDAYLDHKLAVSATADPPKKSSSGHKSSETTAKRGTNERD